INSRDWHWMVRVWKRLHDDGSYNISTVPLVLLERASEVGDHGIRLNYSPYELQVTLARYNGRGPKAREYGAELYGVPDPRSLQRPVPVVAWPRWLLPVPGAPRKVRPRVARRGAPWRARRRALHSGRTATVQRLMQQGRRGPPFWIRTTATAAATTSGKR